LSKKHIAIFESEEQRYLRIRIEISMTLEGYSRTWWDERASAVSAVVNMVMNSDATDKSDQQHIGDGARRMMFQQKSETFASGAPTGAPAPIAVHSQSAESAVSG
jgi:hypothetical protein